MSWVYARLLGLLKVCSSARTFSQVSTETFQLRALVWELVSQGLKEEEMCFGDCDNHKRSLTYSEVLGNMPNLWWSSGSMSQHETKFSAYSQMHPKFLEMIEVFPLPLRRPWYYQHPKYVLKFWLSSTLSDTKTSVLMIMNSIQEIDIKPFRWLLCMQ